LRYTVQTARKLLILNGEMSEWSIEHAWKSNRAKRIEQHRNAPKRNRFTDFLFQNVARCDAVNSGVRRWL